MESDGGEVMRKLKKGVDPFDFLKLKLATIFMLEKIVEYCALSELDLVITSLISDRDGVKTVSNTHAEGRAFDIRTRDWTEEQILNLETWANIEFKEIGAFNKAGQVRAAVYHNRHLHFQVRR